MIRLINCLASTVSVKFNIFLLLFNFGCFQLSFAQVAVNDDGTNADNSAMLDINAPDKGLLIPRVELVSASNPISNPATGLMVYNSSAHYEGSGFYFFDGSDWVQLGAGISQSLWTEGSGTDIYRLSNVGIGNANPGSRLHISGGNITVQGAAPTDIWGTSVIGIGNSGTNNATQGIIGHQGAHRLDLWWNFYRNNQSGQNFSHLNANGFSAASGISFDNNGIVFRAHPDYASVTGAGNSTTALPIERMRIQNDGIVEIPGTVNAGTVNTTTVNGTYLNATGGTHIPWSADNNNYLSASQTIIRGAGGSPTYARFTSGGLRLENNLIYTSSHTNGSPNATGKLVRKWQGNVTGSSGNNIIFNDGLYRIRLRDDNLDFSRVGGGAITISSIEIGSSTGGGGSNSGDPWASFIGGSFPTSNDTGACRFVSERIQNAPATYKVCVQRKGGTNQTTVIIEAYYRE